VGNVMTTALADSLTDSLSVAGTGAYEVTMADPIVGGSLTAFSGSEFVRSFDLEGWAKAPVASVASGAGTGAWDYGAGASLALGIGETMLFTSATYWVLGDMPDLALNDAVFYSVAVGRSVGSAWSVLASASGSTRVTDAIDPAASVSVNLSRRMSGGSSLSMGLGMGVTESASTFTASVGWSTRLMGRP
jgi:hypothetical protein